MNGLNYFVAIQNIENAEISLYKGIQLSSNNALGWFSTLYFFIGDALALTKSCTVIP
jgi:hypothetical protein